jgi:hypothetical protein
LASKVTGGLRYVAELQDPGGNLEELRWLHERARSSLRELAGIVVATIADPCACSKVLHELEGRYPIHSHNCDAVYHVVASIAAPLWLEAHRFGLMLRPPIDRPPWPSTPPLGIRSIARPRPACYSAPLPSPGDGLQNLDERAASSGCLSNSKSDPDLASLLVALDDDNRAVVYADVERLTQKAGLAASKIAALYARASVNKRPHPVDSSPPPSAPPSPPPVSCDGCLSAISKTVADEQAATDFGMMSKPRHMHCHYCGQIGREECSGVCGYCRSVARTDEPGTSAITLTAVSDGCCPYGAPSSVNYQRGL